MPPDDMEAQAAAIEEQLIEAEEEQAAELEAAAEAEEASQDATSATSHKAATAGDRTARRLTTLR